MHNRSEAGVVIGGDLPDLAGSFGLRVDFGIATSHEPEHRRHVPLRSETAKVLACRCRLGLLYAFSGEVRSKGVGDAPGCLRVVSDKSVAVEDRDLRLLRRTGRLRLRIHDALDGRE